MGRLHKRSQGDILMAKKQIENRPRKSKFKTMSHAGGNSRPLKDKVERIGNKWFMKKQEKQDE